MLKNLGQGYDSVDKSAEKTMITMEDGSSKEVWNRYKAINDAVDGTAYSFDEAALASANFLAVNEELTNQDLTKVLRASQGIAATYSKDFSQVTGYLQKIQTQGSLTKGIVSDMKMVGIAIEPIIQKHLGIVGATAKEMDKLYETGAIKYEDVVDALYNKFNGSLNKANDTFEGATSNMRSAMSRIGAVFYEPMIKHLINGANQVRLAMNALKSGIVDSKLPDVINGIIGGFINGIDKIFFTVDENGKKINNFTRAIFSRLSSYLEGFGNIILTVKEVFVDFGKAFYDVFLKGSFSKARGNADSFRDATAKMLETVKSYKTEIINGFKGLLYLLKPLVKILSVAIKLAFKIFTILAKGLIIIIGLVGNLITLVAESKIFNLIIDKISKAFETFVGWLKKGKDFVVEFFASLKIGEKVTEVFWNIVDAVKEFNEKYKPLQTAIDGIESGFVKIYNAVTNAIEKLLELIGFKIDIPSLTDIKTGFQELGDKISWAFDHPKEAADAFVEKLKAVKDYISTGFSTAVDTINDKVKTFHDWITGFKGGFDDAEKSLDEFAESDSLEKTEKKFSVLDKISDSLSGFKESISNFWSALKDVFVKIKDFFAEALGNLSDATGVKDLSTFLDFLLKIGKLLVTFGWAEAANGIGQFFGTLAKAMKEGMGGSSSLLKTLPDAMLKIAEALGILALVVIALGSIKPEAAKQAEEILFYITMMAAIMAKVIKQLGSLKKNTESAIDYTDDAGRKFKVGGDFAKTLGKSIGSTFGKAAEMYALGKMVRDLAIGFAAIFASFWIFSKAIKGEDGKTDWSTLAAGATAFVVIMGIMTHCIKIILKSLKSVSKSTDDGLTMIKDRGGEKKQGKEWIKEFKQGAKTSEDTSTPWGAILATAGLIVAISSAVVVMGLAMAALGALPGNVLLKGGAALIGVIIGVMAALLAVTKLLSKKQDGSVDQAGLAKQLVVMAEFVVAISAAIMLLIPSVIALGLLMKADSKMVWSGIGAVAVLGLILSVCGAVIGATSNKSGSLGLLIGLAVTLFILISQIRKLASDSDVDTGKLISSIIGIAAILFVATLIIKAADKVEKALNVAALIISLAATVAAIGYAVSSISKASYGKTWSSVGAIIVLVAALGGVMLLLSKLAGGKGTALLDALAIAFVGIGAAVFLLAAAMRIILPLIDQIYDNRDGVKKKLTAFADIIAATVVGFVASLLDALAAESLNLINSLGRLLLNLLVGIVDWICVNAYEIGAAVGNLLAAIVVIIATAIKVFIGDLIAVIAKALGIASPSKVFIKIGKFIVQGLINGIKAIFSLLSKAVEALFDIIMNFIPEPLKWLWQMGKDLVTGLIDGLKTMFGDITDIVGKVLGLIKNPFSLENWKDLGSSIMNLFKDGLSSVAGAISTVADGIVEGIMGPIREARTELDEFGKTSAGGIIGKLKENAGLKMVVDNYVKAYNDFQKFLSSNRTEGKTVQHRDEKGNLLYTETVAGEDKVKEAMALFKKQSYDSIMRTGTDTEKKRATELKKIYDEYHKQFAVIVSMYDDMSHYGKTAIKTMTEGMTREEYNATMQKLGQMGYNTTTADWWILGNYVGEETINGLLYGLDKIPLDTVTQKKADELKKGLTNAKALAISSPSKYTIWVGEMVMDGLGIGLSDGLPGVLDIMGTAVSDIKDIGADATITPVFDLSEIQNEAETAASTMAEMKTNIPQEVDLLNNTNANKIDYLGESVDGLSDSLSTSTLEQIITTQNGMIQALSDKLNEMGVYIDGRTLVGAVIDKIDNQLGSRVGQVGRGVAI